MNLFSYSLVSVRQQIAEKVKGKFMSEPASAGLFIYAKNVEKIAGFYQSLLSMDRIHATSDLIVLGSQDIQIIVHAIPTEISEHIEISTPPVKRDDAAYKFFFTVPSITEVKEKASLLGGEVLPDQWSGPGFVVSNAVDPEGNIFQVRGRAPNE